MSPIPALHVLAAVLLAPLAALAAPDLPRTAASDHPLAGRIVDVAAGRFLPGPAALVDRLAQADVVFLGEIHDNAEHHAAQAWLTAALAPSGLAFEMIRAEDEATLAKLRAEGADDARLAEALDWTERGWPAFALYAPVLAAAPQAAVTGAEAPPEALSQAMAEGAAAALDARLEAGAAARFGLDAPLSQEAAEAATAEQVAAHCGLIPAEAAARMVEAQRLRDALIADAALRARDASAPGDVAVITGAGHARAEAAPAALAAARPNLSTATVAFVELGEATDWADYPTGYDYLWFTVPEEREDPCEAFARSFKDGTSAAARDER